MQRGVGGDFLHAHLHFLRRLTDGRCRRSRRKSQNQTPAMETRLRLRCVCVLALVILKGKVMVKKSIFFFNLPNWETNPVQLQLAGRGEVTCRFRFLTGSDERRPHASVGRKHFEEWLSLTGGKKKFQTKVSCWLLCWIHFDRCSGFASSHRESGDDAFADRVWRLQSLFRRKNLPFN